MIIVVLTSLKHSYGNDMSTFTNYWKDKTKVKIRGT